MRINISGKNIKITNQMSDYTEKRLKFLNKFLRNDEIVNVKVSTTRNDKTDCKVEVYFNYNKKEVKIEERGIKFIPTLDVLNSKLKNKITTLNAKMTEKEKKSIKDYNKKILKAEEKEIIEELESKNKI